MLSIRAYPGFMKTLPKWMVALKSFSNTGFRRSYSENMMYNWVALQRIITTLRLCAMCTLNSTCAYAHIHTPFPPLKLRQKWWEHQLHPDPCSDRRPETPDWRAKFVYIYTRQKRMKKWWIVFQLYRTPIIPNTLYMCVHWYRCVYCVSSLISSNAEI